MAIIGIIVLLIYIRSLHSEINNAREEEKRRDSKYWVALEMNIELQSHIELLQDKLNYYNNYSKDYIDNDIKKAIKYAMINSHPDKGGRTEDFIVFKELYDKYK